MMMMMMLMMLMILQLGAPVVTPSFGSLEERCNPPTHPMVVVVNASVTRIHALAQDS